MNKPAPLITALSLLIALPGLASASSKAKPDLDNQIRCATLFTYVSSLQEVGEPGLERFPSMIKPAEAFFAKTAEKVHKERGIDYDKVLGYMMDLGDPFIADIDASANPPAALDRAMANCLPLFERVAPESAPRK